MEIILIVILIILLYLWWKSYKIKYDTIIAFTGGLGSGKSLLSVQKCIYLLRKQRQKVKRINRFRKFLNLFRKEKKALEPKPMLYSSIPVRISKKEYSVILTAEHLLLSWRIMKKSVVFIDEVGSWLSQFDYKGTNVSSFDEFVRLYRHYTQGGYLVVNDQCSENIVLQVRRRINQVFNLMHFKKWFGIIYTVKVRNISISEEIKTVEENDTEDNMTTLFGLMPFFKRYDTYCYSERYDIVPYFPDIPYTKMKKHDLLTCPKYLVKKMTL